MKHADGTGAGMAITHTRRGLTVIELLLSVSISALVLYASFALVSAYAYANREVQDLRPLRSQASTLQMYILNWLRQSQRVLYVTVPKKQVTVTTPGVQEVGNVQILVYRGDSTERPYDSMIQIDELALLEWTYALSFDPSKSVLNVSGQLVHSYVASEDDTPVIRPGPPTGPNDDSRDYLTSVPTDFMTADLVTEVIAEDVYRFDVVDFIDPGSVEINATLMDFNQVRPDVSAPNGLFMPPTYSFGVVGAPDIYVAAKGYK